MNKLIDDLSSKENIGSPDHNNTNIIADNLMKQSRLRDPFGENLSEISNCYLERRHQYKDQYYYHIYLFNHWIVP